MSLSLSEIERGLRRELEDMARRVPPPREFAYIIEELKDILRQVFGSDHMLLEAWLTPRVTWRHKCVYKLDPRESYEYEVVEALGNLWFRADVYVQGKWYFVYAEFEAHFATVPERSAYIVLYLKPPHELIVKE